MIIEDILKEIKKTLKQLDLMHQIQKVKKLQELIKNINKKIKPLTYLEKFFKCDRATEKLTIQSLLENSLYDYNRIDISDIIKEYQFSSNTQRGYSFYEGTDRTNDLLKLRKILKVYRKNNNSYELTEKEIDDIFKQVFVR